MSALFTFAFSCRERNSSYSPSVSKSGGSRFSSNRISTPASNFVSSSPKSISSASSDSNAEPYAAKRWELSGSTVVSGVNFKVLIKEAFNSVKKWSGPPKNATVPRIGLPHARPETVWFTTA